MRPNGGRHQRAWSSQRPRHADGKVPVDRSGRGGGLGAARDVRWGLEFVRVAQWKDSPFPGGAPIVLGPSSSPVAVRQHVADGGRPTAAGVHDARGRRVE